MLVYRTYADVQVVQLDSASVIHSQNIPVNVLMLGASQATGELLICAHYNVNTLCSTENVEQLVQIPAPILTAHYPVTDTAQMDAFVQMERCGMTLTTLGAFLVTSVPVSIMERYLAPEVPILHSVSHAHVIEENGDVLTEIALDHVQLLEDLTSPPLIILVTTFSTTDNKFSVVGELKKCEIKDTTTCLKSIVISLEYGTEIIEIQPTGSVNVNRIFSQLPVSSAIQNIEVIFQLK
ncbi:uncharacterized protein LOC121393427 [Xenopus laevis]|uniref:Uncharacterized protein LOC121393427 n=1 Tax=Xenopus laevis TaxID=8355 RepID=A0A8J1KNN4_XENLA|nr:uncharacterized protein LOC121393427 [Xenopus laevis]